MSEETNEKPTMTQAAKAIDVVWGLQQQVLDANLTLAVLREQYDAQTMMFNQALEMLAELQVRALLEHWKRVKAGEVRPQNFVAPVLPTPLKCGKCPEVATQLVTIRRGDEEPETDPRCAAHSP